MILPEADPAAWSILTPPAGRPTGSESGGSVALPTIVMAHPLARVLVPGLLLAPALAQVSDPGSWPRVHGPLVHWRGDATTSAEVVWIERTDRPEGPGWTEELADTAGQPRVVMRAVLDLAEDLPEGAALSVDIEGGAPLIAWWDDEEVGRWGVVAGEGAEARGVVRQSVPPDLVVRDLHGGAAYVFDSTTGSWQPGERGRRHVLALELHDPGDGGLPQQLPSLWITDASGERRPQAATWRALVGRDPVSGWQRGDFVPPPGPAVGPVPRKAWVQPPGGEWVAVEGEARPVGPSGSTARRAWFGGLSPGTRYGVAVGVEAPAQAGAWFETAPADPAVPIRFVAGGDMFHRREWLDAMNARAGALAPTFALLGGDLAYGNGKDARRWYAWVDSWVELARTQDDRLIPMIAAIGNHETRSGKTPLERAPYYYPLFGAPPGVPFFTVDVPGRLGVIVLDSGHTTQIAGAQMTWLDEALRPRADLPHLIAVYHRPAYGTAKAPSIPIREHWVPLFERHGVDVVYENDHHTYKRTHLLRGGVPAPDGILYLGDGAWGVGTRGVPDLAERPDLAHAESTRHLILTTLAEGRHSHQAIDAAGNVFDSWSRDD